MNKEDLNQLLTRKDLENWGENFLAVLMAKINPSKNSLKEFYTSKEFAHLTGLKYSTVIYKAKTGAIKARQDGPSCSWQISASELDRFKNEANENI